MSEPTKCCGNCQWWEGVRQEYMVGYCGYLLPDSLCDPLTGEMNYSSGTSCDCFLPLIPQEVQNAIEIIKEDTLIGGYGTRRRIAAEIVASWAIEHMPELKGNQ